MRTIRVLLAAIVVAVGMTVVGPSPAMACSCVGGSVRSYAERAEVVLRGSLLSVDGPDGSGISSSSDPATYTFEVHEVFKGSSPPTRDVVSAVSGASCGLEGMEKGQEYVVFAAPGSGMTTEEDDDQLGANLCGGTDRATPALVEAVERALGPGRPPQADDGGEPAAADPPARAEGVAPTGAWVAGGGLTVALLAGVALLVVRRRRT